MKELSDGMTLYHRTFIPFLFASVSIVGLILSHGQIGLALPGIVLFGYTFWFGRRLSEVWLDGDVLEVKGPTASFSGSAERRAAARNSMGTFASLRPRAGPPSR
jgi:hypothetical protein